MERKTFRQCSVVMAIVAILQLISFPTGKYYLIQIGDEDPVRPELKTTQTPKLPTDTQDNQNSDQHGVDHNRTNSGDCGEKCACVSDPDRKIQKMADSFSSSRGRKSHCCYRWWANGFLCCSWSEFYCSFWGK